MESRDQALGLVEQGHCQLIMHMAPVPFCDSSGFNALIGILRGAMGAGG
ncbi:hypothetical protein [Streptomyces sp. NPDC002889]